MLNVFKIQSVNFEHIHQNGYSFAQLSLIKLSIYISCASLSSDIKPKKNEKKWFKLTKK